MSTIIMEKKNTKESEKFEFRYGRKTEPENNKDDAYDIVKEIEKKYGNVIKDKNKK